MEESPRICPFPTNNGTRPLRGHILGRGRVPLYYRNGQIVKLSPIRNLTCACNLTESVKKRSREQKAKDINK